MKEIQIGNMTVLSNRRDSSRIWLIIATLITIILFIVIV